MTRALMVMGAAVLAGTALIGQQRPAAASLDKARLEAAINKEVVDGDLRAAIAMYRELTQSTDRAVAAQSYLRLGQGYRRLGDPQAKPTLQRALEFKDQPQVVAKARAALGLRAQTGAVVANGPSMRRVWEGPDVDISGSISPDGKFLSFVDWSTGDLALRDLTTGTSRRLTNKGSWQQSGEFAERVVYSRDGRYLAYSWNTGSEATGYEIRILDLQAPAGSAPRRLAPTAAPVRWTWPHEWSPDGKWVLASVTSQARRDSLVLLDVRTGATVRTVATHEVDAARFSADGALVAFDRPRSDNLTSDIVLAGTEDARESTLDVGAGLNAPLAWPSEGHLLFSSTRKGRSGVWLQRMDGRTARGEPTLVKSDLWSRGLGMTAAGGLALATRPANREIHVADLDEAGLVRPGSVRALDAPLGNVLHPAVSQDGKSLAYVMRREDGTLTPTLGIMDTRTGAVRHVPLALRLFRRPRWAPDAQSLVAQGTTLDERQGLFRIDVDTGAVTPLVMGTAPAEMLSAPEWAPDGTQLYYIRTLRPSGVQSCSIVARDMRSGHERQVRECTGFGRFALSADGARIAQVVGADISAAAKSLQVAPVAGGDSREIYRVEDPDTSLDAVSWMPDGRHVIVVRGKQTTGTTQRREALLVPVNGGTPKVLQLPPTVSERVDVSADGKRLSFVAGELRQEVWVLENVLPGAKPTR